MSNLKDRLDFYLTIEHPCGYYDDRSSQNIVPDPDFTMDGRVYSQLVANGFRRSGDHVYRPHCQGCNDCIAVRINPAEFTPKRNQRRTLKANSDIDIIVKPAEFTQEYFELYRQYINSRHADGNMADPDKNDFTRFLFCNWGDTLFIEFRFKPTAKDQPGKLAGIAVTDLLSNGLSAVYTFFDPEMSKRSLGIFSILSQIDLCQQYGLPYLYLGYWIPEHPKMHYKSQFNGLEYYRNNIWLTDKTLVTDPERY